MFSVSPQDHSLFLDLDGTLVDIQAKPGDVIAPADLVGTMRDLLRAFEGAVAIVSGRRICDTDRVLAPLRLVTAGVHGIELRVEENGATETMAPTFPKALLRALEFLPDEFRGITLEPKGAAVAVHFRQAPGLRASLQEKLMHLTSDYGRHLELGQGRMVYEILPKNYSKGTAIEILSQLSAFKGRKPIMIGDDAPDVAALRTAQRLGGLGLRVAGEFFPAATAEFQTTADVRRWLKQISESSTCR